MGSLFLVVRLIEQWRLIGNLLILKKIKLKIVIIIPL